MVSALSKARSQIRAISNSAYTAGTSKAPSSFNIAPSSGLSQLGEFDLQNKYRQRYALFKGWVHAAVHAKASAGADQPVNLGRIKKKSKKSPKTSKAALSKMPKQMRTKSADEEVEAILDHPLLDSLRRPNEVQYTWQFVYSFMCNLDLTGWSYIVGDSDKNGRLTLFSVPTTWVTPDHSDGPFSKITVRNPKDPEKRVEGEEFKRGQFAFVNIPNPADPLAALAPAGAQIRAIRIDDNIQTSQEVFFDQGVWPSVVVTVGNNPHPDVSPSWRPRLSGPQRRQVNTAIRKTMQGVANYGNPAIIDGLIEKIEKLSMDSNELGWHKSEKAIKTRILAAFGVHAYLLGEEVPGSYAQVANIEKIFYRKVNTYLDMLGMVLTDFIQPLSGEDEKLVIWWDECVAEDPSMRQGALFNLRSNDDITQDEIRGEYGFPPDKDRNESVIGKNAPHVVQILGQVGQGAVDRTQAVALFIGMGMPTDLAEKIAGIGLPDPKEEQQQQQEQQQEQQNVQEATEELKKAVELLKQKDPSEMAAEILKVVG